MCLGVEVLMEFDLARGVGNLKHASVVLMWEINGVWVTSVKWVV